MRHVLPCLATAILLMSAGARPARAQAAEYDAVIRDLGNKDPKLRASAALILGANGVKLAVHPLIASLKDEQSEAPRTAFLEALRQITGKSFTQYSDWDVWWETEGVKLYGANIMPWQIREIHEEVEKLNRELEDTKQKMDDTKTWTRVLSLVLFGVAGILILAVILFGIRGGSRLREMRDVMRQTERFIAQGDELTKRTDRILDELESKKTEILGFFTKLKEDNEAEIERFADLLEQNTEHRMREVVMGLREKAEKEIEQTLSEVKETTERELKRTANETQARIDGLFADREKSFMREVDAQTLFLEASFFAINHKHEDAMRTYKRLLALKPDHFMGWNNLGNVYREKQRNDEALEAYLKGLEIAPNNAMLLYNAAASYAMLKDKPRMIESLTRAIQNDGEFKDEALNDPAFKEFWVDPAFKDIAEG